MWGKTQVSFGTFGIYEQTNITVFAMTVAGSSAIPWRPPEAALYLGVIELCTSRLLFQSHDTLPPILVVAEPLVFRLCNLVPSMVEPVNSDPYAGPPQAQIGCY